MIQATLDELAPVPGLSITFIEASSTADRESLAAGDDSRSLIRIAVPGADGLVGHLDVRPARADGGADAAVELGAIEAQLSAFAPILGRLYDQSRRLTHRIAELDAVYRVSTALSGLDRLELILETALHTMIEVMNVSAASIRLFTEESDELHLASWLNLGPDYYERGPFLASESEIDVRALAGEIVYARDLHGDSRVRYPEVVESEGLCSLLCTGMRFRGRPVGVLRLYTREPREFSEFERSLLRAAAQQIATAIVHARLLEQQRQARAARQQIRLASNVQQRMLPQRPPSHPRLDLAGRCLPSLELGGDFFDFLQLGRSIGLAIGDVVGKGVPAALIMASVRASLRAHARDIYNLDEAIRQANRDLVADTIYEEFATVWYGVIDPDSLRLTYCNAGHEPAMLFRRDRRGSGQGSFEIQELRTGGMVIGVDAFTAYEKESCALMPHDTLVAVSDGVPEAVNFDREFYGKSRLRQAVIDLLTQKPDATAADVMNHILWEVRRFTGLATQSDDMTVLVARVREA